MTPEQIAAFKAELKALLEKHDVSISIGADYWGCGGAENPRIEFDHKCETIFKVGDSLDASDL